MKHWIVTAIVHTPFMDSEHLLAVHARTADAAMRWAKGDLKRHYEFYGIETFTIRVTQVTRDWSKEK